MATVKKAPIPQSNLPHLKPAPNVKVSAAVKLPRFENGQLIDGKYVIRRKISEGGFGAVYEVALPDKPEKHFAMKLALTTNPGTDQLVKMEMGLLRRLSKLSPGFPQLHHSGMVSGFRYLVMDLLGPSLAEVQLYMPDEKFTTNSAVRMGLQLIDAIEVIHSCFFIHRDIKPGNMAIGQKQLRQIYLFDFGLARRFVQKGHSEKLDFRQERDKTPFRGTYHYCSISQHKFKDACRRDDLWSFMYTLIEFITGSLPWEHLRDKHKIERMKQETPISILLQGCPLLFEALLKYLDKLEFKSRPSYDFFRKAFHLIMKARNYDDKDPFNWEVLPKSTGSTRQHRSVSMKAVLDCGSHNSITSGPTDPSSSDRTLETNCSEHNVDN